jgi:hypothetical protein
MSDHVFELLSRLRGLRRVKVSELSMAQFTYCDIKSGGWASFETYAGRPLSRAGYYDVLTNGYARLTIKGRRALFEADENRKALAIIEMMGVVHAAHAGK